MDDFTVDETALETYRSVTPAKEVQQEVETAEVEEVETEEEEAEEAEETTETEETETSEETDETETAKKKKITSDELSDEDIAEIKKRSQQNEEEVNNIKKVLEQRQVVDNNSVILGQVDNAINAIDIEAGQLSNLKQTAAEQFDRGEIDRNQYDTINSRITSKALQLKSQYDELNSYKQQIPTQEDFMRKQKVVQSNNAFYSQYVDKNEELKDDIVKKNVEVLKRDYYDNFGEDISKATDFDKNVKWINSMVKEAEKRGYQKAIEKNQEQKAKGKLNATNKTQGQTSKTNSKVMNSNDLLKSKDLNKELSFY